MAITKGTRWYAPIDFGITEAYQRKTGKQIGDYNPAQNAAGKEFSQKTTNTPYSLTPIGGGNAKINYGAMSVPQTTSLEVDAGVGGDGGGGTPDGGGTPTGPSDEEKYMAWLQQQRQNALDAIARKLEQSRRTAGEWVAKAKRYRDEELLPGITQLYSGLQDTARQRASDTETKNRMYARAMNRLGSSVYDQNQMGVNNTLQSQLGGFDTQQASDIRDANETVTDAEAEARRLDETSVNDFDYDVTAADTAFGNIINNIIARNDEAAALKGGYGPKMNQGLSSIMQNLVASSARPTAATNGVQEGNMATIDPMQEILKRRMYS